MKTSEILVFAIAAALMPACQKMDDEAVLHDMTFSVSTAGCLDTKTTLVSDNTENGKAVLIARYDTVGVFPRKADGKVYPFNVPQGSSTSRPDIPITISGRCENSDSYIALCPYNRDALCTYDYYNDKYWIQTNLPYIQSIPSYAINRRNTYDPRAGISIAECDACGVFRLKNVCALVRITFNDTAPVSKLKLSNELAMSNGYLAADGIKISSNGEVNLVSATPKKRFVEFYTYNNTVKKGEECFIAVLPGTFTNLRLEVYDENGTLRWTRICKSSVTFERSKIYAFPEIDTELTYMDFFEIDQFSNSYYLWN